MELGLNDVIGLALSVIAVVAVYYATAIAFQTFRRDKARHSLLLSLFFLVIAVWGTFQELILISTYLQNIMGYNLQAIISISSYTHFLFIGSIFILILFIDIISRERVEPLKLLFFTNLVTAGIVFFIYDESDMINLIFFAIMLFQSFLFLYISAKIYSKSPQSMKSAAIILIIGGIFFTLVPVIFEILPDFGLEIGIPFITQLSIGLGVLAIAYIFKKQPKLAYILPFRASRLTIIDSLRGICIFNHIWDKSSKVDDDLFGGMMQGISGILKETVNRGNIRQIELEQALLLVYRDEKYPVAFVLLSNEFNKSLRLALKQFAEKFYLTFSDKFDDLSNISQFNSASKLVEEVFPFIPEY